MCVPVCVSYQCGVCTSGITNDKNPEEQTREDVCTHRRRIYAATNIPQNFRSNFTFRHVFREKFCAEFHWHLDKQNAKRNNKGGRAPAQTMEFGSAEFRTSENQMRERRARGGLRPNACPKALPCFLPEKWLLLFSARKVTASSSSPKNHLFFFSLSNLISSLYLQNRY